MDSIFLIGAAAVEWPADGVTGAGVICPVIWPDGGIDTAAGCGAVWIKNV